MAELKTKRNKASVEDFLNSIDDEQKRADCFELVKMMSEITGEKPEMWGPSIVGFGSFHYTYASGREGDWPITGFSPRKQNLTIYIMGGFDRHEEILKSLGKHKTSVACLYIKKLDDIRRPLLKKLIKASIKNVLKR